MIGKMGKLSPLICAVCFVACCSAWADDQQKRFIEFPSRRSMTTFDLNTVQLIQPGRFTIIYTVVSIPDFMRFELKVLDTLRAYCTRNDGSYPAPTDLLTLGPPDMPVKNIEVKTVDAKAKGIHWWYPYSGLTDPIRARDPDLMVFFCKRPKAYEDARRLILGGIRDTMLYDCRRGLMAYLLAPEDVGGKPFPVRKSTLAEQYYERVCLAVTDEKPYPAQ